MDNVIIDWRSDSGITKVKYQPDHVYQNEYRHVNNNQATDNITSRKFSSDIFENRLKHYSLPAFLQYKIINTPHNAPPR
ncbi:MAG: hypothetical protein OEQ53_00435, partial [Saprospiraceae bacterium]|nr:hypothetical protein [Saprospiraceae bacterium]